MLLTYLKIKDAYFVFKLTSNSSKKNFFIFTCPETNWRPAAPETGDQIQIFFKYEKNTTQK